MFGNKGSGVPTVIGQGDYFEGILRTRGGLHVDGEVKGTIEAEGNVSIGPEGVVTGEIEADDVVVAGRAEGHVLTRGTLHIRESGRVEGDATFATLQVDRGGEILGQTGTTSGVGAAETADDEDLAGDPIVQLEV